MPQFVLKIENLLPGDIVLTRNSDDPGSQLIRKYSESNYSHALIYVGDSSYIEAGKIVEANNIQRLIFNYPGDVCVLRFRQSNSSIIKDAIAYARSKVGMEYSISEAKIAKSQNTTAAYPNRQICTRLVAKAYENAGARIVEYADYCRPCDIENSAALEKVDNVVREADERDIEIANSQNLVKDFNEITKLLLKRIREILENKYDIQTLSQLTEVSYEIKDKLPIVIDTIKKSGYLDFWEKDMENEPYNFDKKLFKEYYKENSLAAAVQNISNSGNQINLFKFNLCQLLIVKCKLGDNEYIDLMIDLYENLIQWVEKRISTAEKVYEELMENEK